MKKVRKHWEYFFWLPLVFLITLGLFITSCGKDDEEEPIRVIRVQTPKPGVETPEIDKQEPKPDKTNGIVELDKPTGDDPIIFEEKLSDWSGTIHLSFTNDMRGYMTPCG